MLPNGHSSYLDCETLSAAAPVADRDFHRFVLQDSARHNPIFKDNADNVHFGAHEQRSVNATFQSLAAYLLGC